MVDDALKITESALERLLASNGGPGRRFLRLKRCSACFVPTGRDVRGPYQNPILIQRAGAPGAH
jgi:hypothetical protein